MCGRRADGRKGKWLVASNEAHLQYEEGKTGNEMRSCGICDLVVSCYVAISRMSGHYGRGRCPKKARVEFTQLLDTNMTR